MKIFKEIITIINRHLAPFCFGFGAGKLFHRDYELAAWFLFSVSILYIIGYFTERFSK